MVTKVTWPMLDQSVRDEFDEVLDIAAGYASDAISDGNGWVISTAVGVAALEIPEGINAFRTNGYYAAGDGGRRSISW